MIEDDIDSAETVKEALELNGHVVEIALTGPDGLEKARAWSPDVVLCDIGLPPSRKTWRDRAIVEVRGLAASTSSAAPVEAS